MMLVFCATRIVATGSNSYEAAQPFGGTRWGIHPGVGDRARGSLSIDEPV